MVLIQLEHLGVEVMGLVTREELDEIQDNTKVTVYVPFSYMLGGVTLIVGKDKVKKVDMQVDQALKLSVTAWIKANEEPRG